MPQWILSRWILSRWKLAQWTSGAFATDGKRRSGSAEFYQMLLAPWQPRGEPCLAPIRVRHISPTEMARLTDTTEMTRLR